MPNPLRGEAAIAGTDLVLVFDVNALCLAEMALSRTTDAIVADFEAMRLAGRGDLVLMRGLFWAGMQRRHECDLDAAADRMSDLDIAAIRDGIFAGLQAAFGLAKEGEDRPRPPKPKRGTG